MDDLLETRPAAAESARTRPDRAIIDARFTRDSLGEACAMVRSAGIDADIAPKDIRDLLISVNEIITNAIRYAGGMGTITVERLACGLLTEIRDNGPGLPDGVAMLRPTPDAPEGSGLWRARLLSQEFELISSPRGVTVRIFTPCATASASYPTAEPDFEDFAGAPRRARQFAAIPLDSERSGSDSL